MRTDRMPVSHGEDSRSKESWVEEFGDFQCKGHCTVEIHLLAPGPLENKDRLETNPDSLPFLLFESGANVT